MKNKDSMIGKKFGLLTVLSFNGYSQTTKDKIKMYNCICECGKYTVASKKALNKGEKKSCGCLRGKNNFVDLTGRKIGLLTVIERVPNKNGHVFYKCKCDCGRNREVQAYALKKCEIISCGCSGYKLEHHNLSYTRLCRIWRGMKQRCYNSKAINYQYYGAKGVTVCEEWKESFTSFYEWSISNGYQENLTIDRIDPFGNYEPLNCRWSTYKEQAKNQRKHHNL